MRLPVLCPQLYDGFEMKVTDCDRCSSGWDKTKNRCTIYTGAEDFDAVPIEVIPECPMQDRCQHGLQADICAVRRSGQICESALTWAGVPNAADHPLSFNASDL